MLAANGKDFKEKLKVITDFYLKDFDDYKLDLQPRAAEYRGLGGGLYSPSTFCLVFKNIVLTLLI